MKNKSFNNLLSDNRTQLIIITTCIAFTILTTFFLPPVLRPLFNGPEGIRWVAPFFLLMGTLATIYCFYMLSYKKVSLMSEYFLAGAVVTFFIGIITFIALQRFSSGLRYIETYNEIMAIRFSQVKCIYPDPELGPVGTVYTPFFFILTGIFHSFLPAGFGYGRLVSLAALLVTVYFVFRIVVLRGNSQNAGLWTSAVFLATYFPMDALYDQSGVDTLQMCLTCITLFFFLKDTPRDDMLALLLGGLACFTKQSAVYPFIIVLITVAVKRRTLWTYSPLLFWAAIGGLLIMITKGWAITYLITYPAKHGLRTVPPLFLLHRFFLLQLLLWGCVMYTGIKHWEHRFHIFFLAVVAASISGIYKSGGGIHPLFPTEPLLCIAAASIFYRYKIILVFQLLLGLNNPFTALYPWKTIHDADQQIVEMANKTPGEVWLPMDTYLYSRTEKTEWDNFCALFGPIWSGHPPPKRLITALEEKRFDLILIRKNSTDLYRFLHPDIRSLITQNYIRKDSETVVIYTRKQ